MEIEISKIKIGKRMRKEIGDLTDLKTSIKKHGLLHPIVVDAGNNLIVGYRRLIAFKEMNISEIPATILNLDDPLNAEYDENAVRKDFTPSEAVEITKHIEPILKKQALARMSEGVKGVEISTPLGRTKEQAAKMVGMSAPTLKKAIEVVESGDKEIIKEMDETGNIDKAYREVKGIKTPTKQVELIELPKVQTSWGALIDYVEDTIEMDRTTEDWVKVTFYVSKKTKKFSQFKPYENIEVKDKCKNYNKSKLQCRQCTIEQMTHKACSY